MTKNIIDIAAAIHHLYQKVFQEDDLTEMKMHKLLYFAQKEHYRNFGQWLFDDDFEGWIHGPVNKKVRNAFKSLHEFDIDSLDLNEEYTIREVVHEYGKHSAGVLRNKSHDDFAYKRSRTNLSEDDPGQNIMNKEDILFDIQEEEIENDSESLC
ncbi:hypothetical protein CR203_06455 [Salipaludibacillus neizhouensis]|uniref:Antitoxin SocA-like Panacea domain-containing protein n=1 Tax=Salipaludibacillus neizhouensis TaxID=885475 RepID=A0A3A9KK13_9BACI|nr:type II toxin-antitoxin system antitoxin SocA domain-containing protein [Salipaludibacillus neizhouensis]RKL68125.1 hypothetical protein CR203_06455 [Salipaludibacillus neizhouensis]